MTVLQTPPQEPLYQSIVREIRAMIDRGTLRAGDRVPSIRKLRKQSGRSVSTILHAYQILEGLGVIEARPQSGYFVKCRASPSSSIATSAPPRKPQSVNVIDRLQRINREMCDPSLVPLGGAHPGRDMLPIRALARIERTLSRTALRGMDWYEFPAGGIELQRAIAREYIDAGCTLAPEDIVVTCGAQEALVLCLRAAAGAGDVVAVESPAYFGVLQALETLGMRAVEIPTDPVTGLDLAALEDTLARQKVKALIICGNGQNPLGYVTSDDHKRQLVEIITKHGVPMIEDDVYADLCYGIRPKVCKAFDAEGWVMLCSSFSKTLTPGMRIGWCAPGPKWRNKLEQLKFCTTIASATVPQQVIARYIDEGGYHRHLRKVSRVYEQQVRLAASTVLDHFPDGTSTTTPAGGFVLWVELPVGVDALRLQESSARAGISIAPGPLFSPSGRFTHHIRLSLGFKWNDRMEKAIARVGEFAKQRLV